MAKADVDRIMEDLFMVLPIFLRKLWRMDLSGTTGNLTRHHLAIVGMIAHGKLTVSDMARKLGMPKPQMTHIVDQLVDMGIVERQPSTTDRRVINLVVTEHGRSMGHEMKQKVMANIQNKLAVLSPEELEEMAAALDTLRRISSRLVNNSDVEEHKAYFLHRHQL
jgi:DNA-binding MarR family transcriptional regulator